jgi:hypothetical protein
MNGAVTLPLSSGEALAVAEALSDRIRSIAPQDDHRSAERLMLAGVLERLATLGMAELRAMGLMA